jgi:hypothetical protein
MGVATRSDGAAVSTIVMIQIRVAVMMYFPLSGTMPAFTSSLEKGFFILSIRYV